MLTDTTESRIHLGVVSFFNSKPLIDGLDREPGVTLRFAVPSALPELLRADQVDAALIPVIDLAREGGAWAIISDACIASDGETMTVRVFSRVPPEQMKVLYVDSDSHTSVCLARVLWSRRYDRRLELRPLPPLDRLSDCESVLLIGDKVVTAPVQEFNHQVDLGGAWKEWTGLPFVFAVWAAPKEPTAERGGERERERRTYGEMRSEAGTRGRGDAVRMEPAARQYLARVLSAARDRGVGRAAAIAAEMGPAHGWPVELATTYLTKRLTFKLTPQAREGLEKFIELATDEGLVSQTARTTV